MHRVEDDELVRVLVTLRCHWLDVVAVAGEALGRPDALDALAALDGVLMSDDRFLLDPRVTSPTQADRALVETAGMAVGGFLIEVDEHHEAARMAMAASLPAVMRDIVRAVLRVQPPRVAPPVLREWRDSGTLPDDDPHASWLAVACAAAGPSVRPEVIERYEVVRQAFEDAGDVEAEISVGLAMAIHARRADDPGTVLRLVARAEALVAAGHDEALAPAVLGRALGHQLRGAPDEALATLDDFPRDRLEGDWRAQVAMMRGANLMLLDRAEEAIDALTVAIGHGSEWSHAVALELMGAARWHTGDAVGAIEDLRWAEEVGLRTGASATAHLAAGHRAAMEAADGRPEAERTAIGPAGGPRDEEVERLLAVAEALRAVAAADHDRAARVAARLPRPGRAVRSAPWIVALRAALLDEDEHLGDLRRVPPAIAAAVAAGRAGAVHLAGGPRAPASARASLPAAWCEAGPCTVEVCLLGDAVIRRDGRTVDHPDWDRARVRELCLHLALVTGCSREQVATDLWPDREAAAADRNLRVTLTYLTNLLDPDRGPRVASELIDSRAGMLSFADAARLRVDLREAAAATDAIRDGAALGDDARLVRGARTLLRYPGGELLGGAIAAPWVERHDRERRDAILRAARAGTPRLARLGHHELAEALARRGIDQDPWAERLHQVVVRACLARDDLDAARRALRTGLASLAELRVQPEQATIDLARLLGMAIDR